MKLVGITFGPNAQIRNILQMLLKMLNDAFKQACKVEAFILLSICLITTEQSFCNTKCTKTFICKLKKKKELSFFLTKYLLLILQYFFAVSAISRC